jgi:hypothetical protein
MGAVSWVGFYRPMNVLILKIHLYFYEKLVDYFAVGSPYY